MCLSKNTKIKRVIHTYIYILYYRWTLSCNIKGNILISSI